MHKPFAAMLVAGSMSLGACSTLGDDGTLESAGTGAAVGAAAGAGIGAIAGDVLAGAAIGAAIGGVAGAVWADRNNDGRTDGYYQNGTYYEGVPSGYQPPR